MNIVESNIHVSTVGIRALNMRNSMQKKRQPALLYALLDSLPIPRYSSPMRRPIHKCDSRRRRVSVYNKLP